MFGLINVVSQKGKILGKQVEIKPVQLTINFIFVKTF